jgi:hypothetical protein
MRRALFALLLAAAGLWAASLTPLKIPGALFFEPAATGSGHAAFGYLSKAVPTDEEVAAQRKRLQAIVDEGLKREYGGMAGYEKAMERAGEEAAKSAADAPGWARMLMPPSLIKEAVPLLMKGALLYLTAHPAAATTPIGHVGETGVVLLDEAGGRRKIPLGLDAPVADLEFSADGSVLAVLSDMGYEDETGRFHDVGRIDIIDVKKGKTVLGRIYANAVEELHLSPDGRTLAFLVRNPKNPDERAVRFLDLADGRLLPKILHPVAPPRSGSYRGVKMRFDTFGYTRRGDALWAAEKEGIALYRADSLEPLFRIRGERRCLATAKAHPWLFDAAGRLWDYEAEKRLWHTPLPMGLFYLQARFLPGDAAIVASTELSLFKRLDAATGRIEASSRKARESGAAFLLSEEGAELFCLSPHYPAVKVRYRGKGPRRTKLDLAVFDTRTLSPIRRLASPAGDTFLALGRAGRSLFVSGFDTIYRYETSPRR